MEISEAVMRIWYRFNICWPQGRRDEFERHIQQAIDASTAAATPAPAEARRAAPGESRERREHPNDQNRY